MPLKNHARLDRVIRKKIGRLLRGFYERLRGEGTPTRFVELFDRAKDPRHFSRDSSTTLPNSGK